MAIAEKGIVAALEETRGLAKGVNTQGGKAIHPQVARMLSK